ncbi:MAG: FAD-binding oxidoreductase [Candidatus Hodarchaeales archaeon]|jgi:FAD/FMN-containing dehydrogenase
MRTFDGLLSRIITFTILSILLYYFFKLFETDTQISWIFLVLLFTIVLGGLILVVRYFIQLKREAKEISDKLDSMKSEGMKIYREKYEILLYSRDIADIPKIARLMFNFNASAIIQPKSIEEIKKILLLCEAYRIPLIPRGAGTSGYGGVLPTKKGIILVLTSIDKVINLNNDEFTVEVEAGITWNRLREYLKLKGYDLLLYPSSAPSSTVGGWIASGGFGIGSSKYGEVHKSILSACLIKSDGKEHSLNKSEEFVGSFGIQGILYKCTLKIRPIEPLIHLAVFSRTFQEVQETIVELQEKSPYLLRFIDRKNLDWINEEILELLEQRNPEIQGIISASFLRSDLESSLETKLKEKLSSTMLPDRFASELWNDRFNTLKLKRGGPSLIISEVLIPTTKLRDFQMLLNASYKPDQYTLEIVSTNERYSVVMVWFPTDQRSWSLPFIGSLPYLIRWFRTFHIIRLAAKVDGTSYHNGGFWLNAFPKKGNEEKIKAILRSKEIYDPSRIFNPDKLASGRIPRFLPFLSWSFSLKLSVPILDRVYRLLPKKWR